MSITLQPQKPFTVVRQIANHLDTDVNYVKAVIRDAYSDAIIDTLKLIARGGQRFSLNWLVPVDQSGEGFYISIVTSVYTDSGYTTKNDNYGDEENTYLVQDRILVNLRRGGSGGIDGGTLRRVIKEELKNAAPDPIEFPAFPTMPEFPEMKWDEVLSAIKELNGLIREANKKKVDFSPLKPFFQNILKAIRDKEVTEPSDLSGLEKEVAKATETMKEETTTIKQVLPAMIKREVREVLDSATLNIGPSKATVDVPAPVRSPLNIGKLSS